MFSRVGSWHSNELIHASGGLICSWPRHRHKPDGKIETRIPTPQHTRWLTGSSKWFFILGDVHVRPVHLVLGNVTGVALIPRSTILPEALKVTDPRKLLAETGDRCCDPFHPPALPAEPPCSMHHLQRRSVHVENSSSYATQQSGCTLTVRLLLLA